MDRRCSGAGPGHRAERSVHAATDYSECERCNRPACTPCRRPRAPARRVALPPPTAAPPVRWHNPLLPFGPRSLQPLPSASRLDTQTELGPVDQKRASVDFFCAHIPRRFLSLFCISIARPFSQPAQRTYPAKTTLILRYRVTQSLTLLASHTTSARPANTAQTARSSTRPIR